jgi:hypothetical protein
MNSARNSLFHLIIYFFPSSVKLYVITLFTLALHVSALGPSRGATSLLLGPLQLSVHVHCVITRLFMI